MKKGERLTLKNVVNKLFYLSACELEISKIIARKYAILYYEKQSQKQKTKNNNKRQIKNFRFFLIKC